MATAKPPRMTKAHFVFLADIIKRSRVALDDKAPLSDFDAAITWPVANALGETNPDFDLIQFLDACGVKV